MTRSRPGGVAAGVQTGSRAGAFLRRPLRPFSTALPRSRGGVQCPLHFPVAVRETY